MSAPLRDTLETLDAAVDAIDDLRRELHKLRSRLVTENRQY